MFQEFQPLYKRGTTLFPSHIVFPLIFLFSYAAGLLLISPLGDLVRRRQLILLIVLFSTTLSIPLAVTSSLTVFLAFSFLVGFVSVTPQVLLPLAADLAPAHKRASALSVVFAGLLFGVLIARVFAGIIAQFTSWRVVYYLAIGLQTVVLIGSWALLPDFPAKNQGTGMTYQRILWTMGKYAVTEPVLIQACLVNMGSSASFSAFWVTLTFLLGGDPYNYSTYVGDISITLYRAHYFVPQSRHRPFWLSGYVWCRYGSFCRKGN